MSQQMPLNDEERAALIAYLDGELDEEATRELEARINRDPVVRTEVESLRRTWELLDYLPRAEPSPTFTSRTVERLATQRAGATGAQRLWRRAASLLGWAAAVVAAAAVGFGGVHLLVPREPRDEELARDLRILENRRLYEHADSLDFLRELDHPDLFGDDNP